MAAAEHELISARPFQDHSQKDPQPVTDDKTREESVRRAAEWPARTVTAGCRDQGQGQGAKAARGRQNNRGYSRACRYLLYAIAIKLE